MAKTQNTPATESEIVDGTGAAEGEVPAAEAKKAGAAPRIMVKLEDGTEMTRQDYIRQQFDAGVKRGDIARKLTELTGKKVAYQVVFAATKNRSQPASAETTPSAEPVEGGAAVDEATSE